MKSSEMAPQPLRDPKKYYRKTIAVGSPDEIKNDDNMIVDQATGLRVVSSQFHILFLAGQTLPWNDQIKETVEEAIRLRKADEKAIEIKDLARNKRNRRDRSAATERPPDTKDRADQAPAAQNGNVDASGPEIDNKASGTGTPEKNQAGPTGNL